MGYRHLQACVNDLERTGQLIRIATEVDPNLEAGAIQRRVFEAGGPALLFTNVKGCSFPMLANLFGTRERARYLFRDTLQAVRMLIDLKLDPVQLLRRPLRFRKLPPALWRLRPKPVTSGPVMMHQAKMTELPMLRTWPQDGGAYITLPQVYTEHVEQPGFARSNLGMYRVQISGGAYQADEEIGIHYQTHRGIGIHHEAALRAGRPLRVNIFVGGAPAMTLAAVMPLPEGMTELAFAGVLGGRRIPMIARDGRLPIYAEADFCISGTMVPDKLLPEGPFGDHLGYYSLRHDFPVMKVERVTHRSNAIWPFTTVGRPPQEDTVFGELVHELTGPLIPDVLPGVHQVHAVDAAGVHPLLLAIGSERYTPYRAIDRPQELLTQANAILGQGPLALSKYLLIANRFDDPELDTHQVADFLQHILERVDWTRDLHFQTETTIDTLDYSGRQLNQGSKLVIAAAGSRRRALPTTFSSALSLADGFMNPRICLPGVIAITARHEVSIESFCFAMRHQKAILPFPLIVIVDDSEFVARNLTNFLWVTFTRSDPARDIYGVDAFTENKHWGCRGPLVIDARTKAHHAPPLEADPEIEKRVDAHGAPGGPLHGII